MKRFCAVYTILCLVVCSVLADTGTDEVEKLRGEIQNLNKQISELQKTTELQNAEIERLKKLCKESGIDISPKQKGEKPTQEAISQPMFGVFLGETLDSLKKRFNVHPSTLSFEDNDHPGKMWSVQNDNPNVKQLLVYTYDEKVYTIDVQFTDGGQANYETIKGQLEKKYKSKDEGGLFGAVFGNEIFNTVVDGVEIKIELKRNMNFMENDKLELSYAHNPLSKKVQEEIQKRKKGKIGSEL